MTSAAQEMPIARAAMFDHALLITTQLQAVVYLRSRRTV